MVLRWLTDMLGPGKPEAANTLEAVIRKHVTGTDEQTMKMILAAAGLLGTVAYADWELSEHEERHIRQELERIPRLSAAAIDGICAVLREQKLSIVTVEAPLYARVFREGSEPDQRREILDILVDLAAADDEITVAETNTLRQITTALGLSQDDYNASQARHKEKLSVLKGK